MKLTHMERRAGMTDEEITRTIAEKVEKLGTVFKMVKVIYGGSYNECCICTDQCTDSYDEKRLAMQGQEDWIWILVPEYLNNDNACMAAWDKFSKKFHLTHVVFSMGAKKSEQWEAGWTCASGQDKFCLSSHRRRAMCECMVKAIK